MPTRNKAEKKKIEDRAKLERIIVPIIFVIGIAAFIIISAIMGKNSRLIEPAVSDTTPEPDPCAAVIAELAEEFGGSATYGDKTASLSFKSPADGAMPVVTAYMKSGVLCARITREAAFGSKKQPDDPEPTEDLFGDNSETVLPSGADYEEDAAILPLAQEICRCLCCVYEPEDMESAVRKTAEILRSFSEGTAQKSNMVFGIYLVEFRYSDTDGILTAVCEPA